MKKHYLKNLFGLIVFIFFLHSVKAEGFLGGEVTATHLYGYAYIIKFVGYKDCSSCGGPSYINTNYTCTTNSQFSFFMPLYHVNSMNDEMTHACPTYTTKCSGGNGLGIRTLVFMDTINLIPGNWNITVGGSGGHVSTTNCPGNDTWMMHCNINNLQGAKPLISYPKYPVFVHKKNQAAGLDYSAKAPAGDSLVYSFYWPFKSNTAHVSYASSYSATNFINSSTPIVLDSASGFLSFTPSLAGSFLVGVKCEQYHKFNGVFSKIGTFYRESVVFVQNINTYTPEISVSGSNVVISADTILICKESSQQASVAISFQANDLDSIAPYNKTHIEFVDSIPGAGLITYNNGSTNASALLFWNPTAADLQKNHSIMLTVSDSACPYNLIRTYKYIIRFVDSPPNFSLGNDTTLLNTHVLFLKLPNADKYLWSTGDTTQTLIVAELFNYSNPIKGSIYNAAGCSSSDSINVMFNYVGINQVGRSKFKLYPNPNNGQFYLEITADGKKEYQILIFDALGRKIYIQQIEFENHRKIEIDLGSSPAGVYQMQLISEDGVISRRVVIR